MPLLPLQILNKYKQQGEHKYRERGKGEKMENKTKTHMIFKIITEDFLFVNEL